MSKPSIMQRLLYRFADADSVQGIQRAYVAFFRDAGARVVMDVGCGRGLFLELLREAGVETWGLDGSPEAVALCRQKGHANVTCEEALPGLERLAAEGRAFDGVFCSHLIEHLDGGEAVRLVELCAAVLAPGGRLVLVTPNPRNLKVMTQAFWLDPTHKRPYPRRLLEAMVTEAGLDVVRSFDDPQTGARYLGHEFFELLPDLLRYGTGTFMGLDSLVVAARPGGERTT